MIPGSVFVQGSMASSIRKGIYQALQDKTIHCVIATVGKEGLNLPKLDAVINAEGMRSRLASRQKMRSLTAAEGKKYGLIIDFIDKGKYLRKHARKRLALYKGMTGFKVQIKKVSKDLFPMEGSRWQLK
jgi:superfamily II DNA or RNA helicase